MFRVATKTLKSIGLSIQTCRTMSSLTFAGLRSLNDIVKKELLENKTPAEIADIWYTYHETKDHVHGLVLTGAQGKSIVSLATRCPFFLIPIFRGDGYFHLVSQFQDRHFVCTYLSEYQQHPSGAQPLLTCSVFDDFDTITLVRTDVVNVGIQEDEGRKVVESLLDSYENDKEFQMVKNFNEFPDMFDVDSYVESQRRKWENVNGNIDTTDDNIPVSPVPVS